MKMILAFGLILLSFSGSASTLHNFSFNLHCVWERWEERVDVVARHLAKSRPDVIAFQELCQDDENDMVQGILKALKRHGYPVVSFATQLTHMSWDRYQERLLVVSRHAVQEIEKGLLPVSPLQRGYLAFKIYGIWNINVHLEHRADYAAYREQQVRFLVEKFRGRPHLIMGDFNSGPLSYEQSLLNHEGYVDVFPGFSYPAENPTIMIDGFWLSPELKSRLSQIESRLFFDERHSDIFLSDHLAVEMKAKLH